MDIKKDSWWLRHNTDAALSRARLGYLKVDNIPTQSPRLEQTIHSTPSAGRISFALRSRLESHHQAPAAVEVESSYQVETLRAHKSQERPEQSLSSAFRMPTIMVLRNAASVAPTMTKSIIH